VGTRARRASLKLCTEVVRVSFLLLTPVLHKYQPQKPTSCWVLQGQGLQRHFRRYGFLNSETLSSEDACVMSREVVSLHDPIPSSPRIFGAATGQPHCVPPLLFH
jgi:hypothetical protein